MKLTIALLVLVAAVHISIADPVPYLEAVSMYGEDQSMQENQFNILEEAPESEDENSESVPALSFDDIKNGKEWNEQSFIAALKRLGTLNTPGLKLVKLPKSMIKLMKRMPNHTVIRPSTSVHPESKAQDDVQCIGVLQDMYTLAHADSRLAYKSQNLKCTGSCTSAKACVLEEKPVMVYLLDTNNQLVPKKVNVGCTCSCQ